MKQITSTEQLEFSLNMFQITSCTNQIKLLSDPGRLIEFPKRMAISRAMHSAHCIVSRMNKNNCETMKFLTMSFIVVDMTLECKSSCFPNDQF